MVVVMMRDHQLRRIYVFRNDAVAQIAQLVGNIERFLVLEVNTARGHERNSGFGELTFERCEGNAFSRERHKAEVRDQKSEIRGQVVGRRFSIFHLTFLIYHLRTSWSLRTSV